MVNGAAPGTPMRAVTPAGPTESAQPAPLASSHRESTHCSRLAARVGQISATAVRGPVTGSPAAASTRA